MGLIRAIGRSYWWCLYFHSKHHDLLPYGAFSCRKCDPAEAS